MAKTQMTQRQSKNSGSGHDGKSSKFRTRSIIALKLALMTVGLSLLGLLMAVVAYKFIPVTDTQFMRTMSAQNKVGVNQTWVPLDKISPNLALAVVSSEDNLFTKHNGFSWNAIKQAWNKNATSKKKHGGSTISQQTAKNVFLSNRRTWLRKGLETVATVMIEVIWGKERIMEVYLNVVEFGPGIYGAEAASQKYFHHSAKSITKSEAALMAAVMPSPVRMKIASPSAYVCKRQQKIMSLMRKIGSVKYNQ